jgi:hypothetical protein
MALEERETAGTVTALFGIITLAASLGADLFGIGNGADFGPEQIAGALLGAVAITIGWVLVHSDD